MKPIRVFLADDHQLFLEGLVRLLEAQPGLKTVGTATTGREALSKIEVLRPDVVLMDISMPHLNGIDTMRHVAKVSPKTKVVILSMYDNEEFLDLALSAGAKGYIVKDASAIELLLAIREAYKGNVYLSPCMSRKLVPRYVQTATATATATATKPNKSRTPDLSAREREVLQLIAEGHSTKEMAERLQISAQTVDTHRKHLMKKLNLHRLADLVRYAIRVGLIESHRPPGP